VFSIGRKERYHRGQLRPVRLSVYKKGSGEGGGDSTEIRGLGERNEETIGELQGSDARIISWDSEEVGGRRPEGNGEPFGRYLG